MCCVRARECVCVCERERVCVCVCERERECGNVYDLYAVLSKLYS